MGILLRGLCQSKVIRQRPLPGLAHAFVFWGFCAFALVTLNHAAVGLGIGFLDPAGWFGRFYFYLAAAFAIACAAGIAGLFVRRFFVRPRWLGTKVSYESGIIAWLIFVLMLTYLAAFFTTNGTAACAGVVVGAHAVPAGVSANHSAYQASAPDSQPRNDIPVARRLQQAFRHWWAMRTSGWLPGKDLTQIVSLQAYSCVECGRCSEHCPATNTGKELNPKEIILGVRGLSERGRAGDRKSRCWASTTRRPRCFSAPRAGRASSSARLASSTCPSWWACGAAR